METLESFVGKEYIDFIESNFGKNTLITDNSEFSMGFISKQIAFECNYYSHMGKSVGVVGGHGVQYINDLNDIGGIARCRAGSPCYSTISLGSSYDKKSNESIRRDLLRSHSGRMKFDRVIFVSVFSVNAYADLFDLKVLSSVDIANSFSIYGEPFQLINEVEVHSLLNINNRLLGNKVKIVTYEDAGQFYKPCPKCNCIMQNKQVMDGIPFSHKECPNCHYWE